MRLVENITRTVTKRIFDLVLVVFLSPFLLSLILIVFLISLIIQGSPVIFSQIRPGKNEKLFTLYKFRTMELTHSNEVDDTSKRITGLGKFLRKTSLDELPSILNVIKGEMSLVGPRPLLPEYLDRYDNFQRKRHEVLPGITGLAQISGRNAISWEEKFKYDVDYVKKNSLFIDIFIIFKTITKIFSTKNINHEEDKTMPEFKGRNE